MPQTKADSELQLIFASLAPFFANALLCARLMSLLHELKTGKCLNELQNYLLSFCKSKLAKIFKIASLIELIRNIHQKTCTATFQIENSGIANKFSILGMD